MNALSGPSNSSSGQNHRSAPLITRCRSRRTAERHDQQQRPEQLRQPRRSRQPGGDRRLRRRGQPGEQRARRPCSRSSELTPIARPGLARDVATRSPRAGSRSAQARGCRSLNGRPADVSQARRPPRSRSILRRAGLVRSAPGRRASKSHRASQADRTRQSRRRSRRSCSSAHARAPSDRSNT